MIRIRYHPFQFRKNEVIPIKKTIKIKVMLTYIFLALFWTGFFIEVIRKERKMRKNQRVMEENIEFDRGIE